MDESLIYLKIIVTTFLFLLVALLAANSLIIFLVLLENTWKILYLWEHLSLGSAFQAQTDRYTFLENSYNECLVFR